MEPAAMEYQVVISLLVFPLYGFVLSNSTYMKATKILSPIFYDSHTSHRLFPSTALSSNNEGTSTMNVIILESATYRAMSSEITKTNERAKKKQPPGNFIITRKCRGLDSRNGVDKNKMADEQPGRFARSGRLVARAGSGAGCAAGRSFQRVKVLSACRISIDCSCCAGQAGTLCVTVAVQDYDISSVGI